MAEKSFIDELRFIIETQFGGSSKALALSANVDAGLICRLLSGERDPTPLPVGRIASVVPRDDAERLVRAFLQMLAAEIKKHAKRGALKKTVDVSVNISTP